MLDEPHMRPLRDYACHLRTLGGGFVPDFDPLDGGTAAELLFLLEKPGPKTAPPVGSGFVSMNNPDPTANAFRAFLHRTTIPRTAIVLWNVIPWWNGRVAIGSDERRLGALQVPPLLARLPRLRGIVLVGNAAATLAQPHLAGLGLKVFRTVHPSRQSAIGPRSRERWEKLAEAWQSAWDELHHDAPASVSLPVDQPAYLRHLRQR